MRLSSLDRLSAIAFDHGLTPSDRAAIDEALDHLDQALAEEPGLTEVGYERIFRYVDSHLRRLSQLTADREKYPEIQTVKVASPVVITGAPRSGTTFLHSLLSQDPQHRSPLSWEVEFPSPPPEGAHLLDDPRIEAWTELQSGPRAVHSKSLSNSEFRAKHLMGPTLPEECGSLLGSILRNPTGPWSLARVPSYFQWVVSTQMPVAYAMHRKWLQHLQYKAARAHWLLKYPQHALALEHLFDVYPDAQIILTHRNPSETVSSVASLIGTLRKGAFDHEDDQALGREMLELQAGAMEAVAAFRRKNPKAPIVDVGYRDLVGEPLDVVANVYGRLGLALTPGAAAAMERFVAENPQHQHGDHQHNLAKFGLTERDVSSRMSGYIGSYGELVL